MPEAAAHDTVHITRQVSIKLATGEECHMMGPQVGWFSESGMAVIDIQTRFVGMLWAGAQWQDPREGFME
jgi:hypothetical protein